VTAEEDTVMGVPAQQQGLSFEISKVDLANRYTARIWLWHTEHDSSCLQGAHSWLDTPFFRRL